MGYLALYLTAQWMDNHLSDEHPNSSSIRNTRDHRSRSVYRRGDRARSADGRRSGGSGCKQGPRSSACVGQTLLPRTGAVHTPRAPDRVGPTRRYRATNLTRNGQAKKRSNLDGDRTHTRSHALLRPQRSTLARSPQDRSRAVQLHGALLVHRLQAAWRSWNNLAVEFSVGDRKSTRLNSSHIPLS